MILGILIWVTFFTAIDLYPSQTTTMKPRDVRTPGTQPLRPVERKQRTNTVETQTENTTSTTTESSPVKVMTPSAAIQETEDTGAPAAPIKKQERFNDKVQVVEIPARESKSTTSSGTDAQPSEADPVSPETTTAPLSFDRQTVAHALELAKATFTKKDSQTRILPKGIVPAYITKVANYQKAYKIYNLSKGNHIGFINAINKTFQTNFTFDTSALDVLGYFMNTIFESIVQSSINNSIFNKLIGKKLEFFLQPDLEKMVEKNHIAAYALYEIVSNILEKLAELKTIAAQDKQTDLTLSYFDSTLPIDTWIELTQKLAEQIKLLIPTTDEEKTSQEVSQVFPEKQILSKGIENEAAQELKSLMQQAAKEKTNIEQREALKKQEETVRAKINNSDQIERNLGQIELEIQKMLFDDKTTKEQEFQRSAEAVKTKRLEELKKTIKDRFDTLEKKEKEIKLPQELAPVNTILDAIKKLLTDKKNEPNFKEMFNVLLNAVYKELISYQTVIYRHDLVGDALDYEAQSYILKNEFDHEAIYKPLWEIVIYKLNTLILAYALNIQDYLLDTKLPINLIFKEKDKFKKYSFTPSLKILLILNQNAQYDSDGQPRLEKKANPTSYLQQVAKATSATFDFFADVGEAVGNMFNVLPNWLSSWFTESKKQKEAEQERLQKEDREYNDLLKQILAELTKSTAPIVTPPTQNATPEVVAPAPKESAAAKAIAPEPAAKVSATASSAPKSAASLSVVHSFDPVSVDLDDINKLLGKKTTPPTAPATTAISEPQAKPAPSSFNWQRALFGNSTPEDD
jgi:hypothetical protein